MTNTDSHNTVTTEDTSHSPSTAANIANNVTLLLISRAAVVLAPFILAAFGWLALQYLDGRFREQAVQIDSVQTRVNIVDSAAQVAADKASKVADDLTTTKQALRDQRDLDNQFRQDTKQALDQHSAALTAISNTLAGVSAKIDIWHQQGRP